MANADKTFTYTNARGRIYRYPAEDKICTFWGRISGFDFKAVRAMVRKENKLIRSRWYNSTPLSWLLCPDRGLLHTLRGEIPNWHHVNNRIPKMLRLLLDLGADTPCDLIAHFAEYPFTDWDTGSRCFRILLTHSGSKEFVRQLQVYKLRQIPPPPLQSVVHGQKHIEDYQRHILRFGMRRHLFKNSRLPVEMITTVLSYI